MKYPCPSCGNPRVYKLECKCGSKWATDKDYYMDGFRRAYSAFKHELKGTPTYRNLDAADTILHQAMRYLKEAEKL